MKKLLFVFTALLLFSCSSSSDDNNSSNSDFHPPTWIQGTWTQEGLSPDSGVSFIFSATDLCLMPTSYLKQCQQENVNLIRKYV
jgi:hypothetical protein